MPKSKIPLPTYTPSTAPINPSEKLDCTVAVEADNRRIEQKAKQSKPKRLSHDEIQKLEQEEKNWIKKAKKLENSKEEFLININAEIAEANKKSKELRKQIDENGSGPSRYIIIINFFKQ